MKNMILKKVISTICICVILLADFPVFTYATDGKFISLNISGYDSDQKEVITENNIFYVINDTVYAPIKILEKHTMYNYDDENNAFVRIGQEYKFATSKIVLDYENQIVSVFYSQLHKETYDIDVQFVGNTYFLPLSQMAAYLKSSVVYKDEKTISIISSGISLCDALYDYSVYTTSLDYFRVLDDLFFGDEYLYYQYTVLGYMKSTIFSGKLSKLITPLGEYETCCTIIENAVTNMDVYKALGDENEILAAMEDLQSELNDEVYKKAYNVFKLSANSVITMFEEYKEVNSFGDDSPFDNFFPEEQLEIDEIKELNKKVKYVNHFLEYTEYIHKFFSLNDDNRQALNIVAGFEGRSSAGKAFDKCGEKYGNDFVKGLTSQVVDEVVKESTEDILKSSAKMLFSKINKVKLATAIVSTAFELLGFDLKDNSSYDVLLAYDVVTYITSNSDAIQNDILETIDDSENLRLTLIMTILTQIEGFKIGNKIAKQLNENNDEYYKNDIDQLSRHLSLLYLANTSEKYDSAEGINIVEEQNRKQLAKLNLQSNVIDDDTAISIITLQQTNNTSDSSTSEMWIESAIDVIHNAPDYFDEIGGNPGMGYRLIDITGDDVPEIFYVLYGGSVGSSTVAGLYWTGTKYDTIETNSDFNIYTGYFINPYLNTDTGEIEFYSGVIERDYFTEEPPFIFGGSHFPYNLLKIEYINDSFEVELITERTYDYENLSEAWNEIYNSEKEFMDTHELITDYKDYYSEAYNVSDFGNPVGSFENADNYKNVITIDIAQQIVDGYINS